MSFDLTIEPKKIKKDTGSTVQFQVKGKCDSLIEEKWFCSNPEILDMSQDTGIGTILNNGELYINCDLGDKLVRTKVHILP